MKLLKKSTYQEIDITDYYAVKVGSIWRGIKQENAVFWWLCIYVFFEYVRPQSIYTSIAFIPWAQISLTFVLITAFFDKEVKWVRNPVNPLFIMLYIFILISSFNAFQPSVSWGKITVVANWFLIYFLIITVVNTEKRLFVFILLFLLVSFKMSQHGFRTFAMRGFSFAGFGVSGSPGWFQNSGEFGIQMTIFVPLAMFFILALKQYWGRYKKIFFYLLPFTGLVSIVASSSRGAQLAIVMVGIWFLVVMRVGFKAALGIIVVGWTLYSFLPAEQLERFQTMGDDQTSTQRLEYWKFGFEIMGEHIITGIGYANWISYCRFVHPYGLGEGQVCELTHNSFIEAGAELGTIALVLFLCMIILIFILNARTRKIAEKNNNIFFKYMAYGLDGGLVGFLMSGFFISAFFYPFFWMQLSMTVALHEIAKKQFVNKDKATSQSLY